jgi:hypothetical protein
MNDCYEEWHEGELTAMGQRGKGLRSSEPLYGIYKMGRIHRSENPFHHMLWGLNIALPDSPL